LGKEKDKKEVGVKRGGRERGGDGGLGKRKNVQRCRSLAQGEKALTYMIGKSSARCREIKA